MNVRVAATASLLLAAASSSPAFAGSITAYSDRATFTAAVGGSPTVETFGDVPRFPIPTGVLNSSTNLAVDFGPPITPGLIQPGVTYSTPIGTGLFFNIDGGGGYTGGFLDSLSSGLPLTVIFDGPVSGFGFDTNGLMGSTFDLTINFLSGSPYFDLWQTPGFFGFTSSSQDIVSAVIVGRGGNFGFDLDNFTYSDVGPGTTVVPLPAPLLLLATGLFTLGMFGRRKAA